MKERESIEFLLADDSDDDIVLIRESINDARLSIKLQVVHDGDEALAYLRGALAEERALPDLVLLDLNMPRKNGLEVLVAMKADPALRHVPALVLTTSERPEDITRAYSYGAASYVTKPGEFSEFREMLTTLAKYWLDVARLPPKERGARSPL